MMSSYKHSILPVWKILSKLLRGIGKLLTLWPLLLVVAIFIAPTSPHLRWEYRYSDYGQYRVYHQCTYLGVDGFVNYQHGDDCPFIALITRQP